MPERVLLGSDVENYETLEFLSGIQRVVRDAHIGLTDLLAPLGIDFVPFRTGDLSPQPRTPRHPLFDADPVLDQARVALADLDAFLLLDVNLKADYRAIHLARQQRWRPVIAVIHDIIPLLDAEKFEPAMRMEFRSYLQHLLFISDHIVCTSEKVREDLRNLGWRTKATFHVIPLGSAFRQDPHIACRDGRMSLLYVSTVEPRKGHQELLDAFDLLLADGVDVDLTLIGRRGWASPELVTAILEHPESGGRLNWLIGADDLSLRVRARGACIGLFPSSEEGFGLFLEEGLAMGLKMVVRDIPVFRERAQPNVYFHSADPRDLAATLTRAHETPWSPGEHPVRTMSDFHADLGELVVDALRHGRIPSSM